MIPMRARHALLSLTLVALLAAGCLGEPEQAPAPSKERPALAEAAPECHAGGDVFRDDPLLPQVGVREETFEMPAGCCLVPFLEPGQNLGGFRLSVDGPEGVGVAYAVAGAEELAWRLEVSADGTEQPVPAGTYRYRVEADGAARYRFSVQATSPDANGFCGGTSFSFPTVL